MQDDLERAVYLMRVAADTIRAECSSAEVWFDDADCDGECLAQDLSIAADQLELYIPEGK